MEWFVGKVFNRYGLMGIALCAVGWEVHGYVQDSVIPESKARIEAVQETIRVLKKIEHSLRKPGTHQATDDASDP